MGRLFEDTNKPSVTDNKPKGRLFGGTVAEVKEEKKPTLGGQILRDILKLPVSIAASGKNLVQAIAGKEETPITTKYLGEVKRVGSTFDPAKGPGAKENIEALKDAAGKGIELASYAVGGGAAKKAATTTAKQAFKSTVKTLAKEGAVAGGLGAGGTELQDPDSNLASVAGASALGAGAGAVLGPVVGGISRGIGRLFGQGAEKVASEVPGIPKKKIFTGVEETVIPTGPETTPKKTTLPKGPIESTNQSILLPKTGGNTVTKEAKTIESSLVKSGFDELAPEEKARFNSIGERDQINRVTELVNSAPDIAKEMAVTGRGIPQEIHPQVIFNAVKNKAVADGDIETIISLARSPIATQESLAGQTLRASQILNDTDPVKIIQEITKVRENPDAIVKEVAQAKVKTQSAKIAKDKFTQFIKDIEC